MKADTVINTLLDRCFALHEQVALQRGQKDALHEEIRVQKERIKTLEAQIKTAGLEPYTTEHIDALRP
jgi:flagellar motility protein MotE (MotC chaperone)